MIDRPVRLAVERERPAEITVSGGEVRIEIEGALEFFDRLVGASPRECHISEREMRPWIAVVEFGRSGGQEPRLASLAAHEVRA